MKKISKNVGMYIVLIVLVVSLVNVFLGPDSNQKSSQTNVMPYSAMLNARGCASTMNSSPER